MLLCYMRYYMRSGCSHAVLLAPTIITSCATAAALPASKRTPAGSTPAGAPALLASMRTHVQEAASARSVCLCRTAVVKLRGYAVKQQ